MTPQRRAVASVLDGEHVHLSADVVHDRATALLPEISLATVYNTLNELVAMGEVLEVTTGSGPKRYDPNAHQRHQHLVCESCGALRDVVLPDPAVPELPERQRHGFTVLGAEVLYHGLCPECAGSGASPGLQRQPTVPARSRLATPRRE
jgi:Fe2+ or Zn2+ uptake regulation protein